MNDQEKQKLVKQIAEQLAKIQNKVPLKWRKAVLSEQYIAPDLVKLIDIALKDPKISKEKKEELRLFRPDFAKKVLVENPEVAKRIDDFVEKEIQKAIKAGKLPPREKIKELGIGSLDSILKSKKK